MTSETEPQAASRRGASLAGAKVAGAALLLLLASLALFWPGVVMFDSVGQFGQALTGDFEDWHPPAMAQAWRALHVVFGGQAQPMLVLQMALYWGGLGLLAAALAVERRRSAACVMLAIGAIPLFVGWQGVVLKDTQMLGAMLGACGVVGWWRLRARAVPAAAIVGVAVLLGYATLVRANAVFATVPLLVMLFGPTRWWARGVVCAVGVVAVLGVAQGVNHAVLGAAASGVERTEAFYDLAGIAVRDPSSAIGLTPAEAREVAARHCVKPLFWDPLGTEDRCGPTLERLHRYKAGQLYPMLAEAIVRHPFAYVAHRLSHLDSTERWLVPANWPSAAPPAVSEPNSLGLGSPVAVAKTWQGAAKWLAETPLGWPIAWLALAIVAACVALRRQASPLRDLALALLVSAIALEASFGVISIASDLRYHLWSMAATALAGVLLRAEARWSRRAVWIGGAALALIVITGTAARVVLPPPPTSYQALLQ